MNALLTLFYLLLCVGIVIFVPPLVVPYVGDYGVVTGFDMARAVLSCTALAAFAGLYAYKRKVDGPFLLRLFVAALLVRIIIATAIFIFHAQDFFGGDAITYDFFGQAQLQGWLGDKYSQAIANQFVRSGEGSGWGMVYLVAAVYGLIGRNMLAVQLINSVLGAATAVTIFLCAQQVFHNFRVARLAGIAVAFYPSLVLWSAQGLKDGPVVFLLALAILCTLKLGEEPRSKIHCCFVTRAIRSDCSAVLCFLYDLCRHRRSVCHRHAAGDGYKFRPPVYSRHSGGAGFDLRRCHALG